ncbi:MAG: M3 family metallopeptidase [Pseudomonadota bacterium]
MDNTNLPLNPLLEHAGAPRFDRISPTDVRPAISHLLTQTQALIDQLSTQTEVTHWANFVAPLADGMEALSRAWGIVGHLHGVNDTPDWRAAYNDLLPEVTRFYAELGQNLALFARYKALRASDEYPRLSAAQRKIIDNEIRDFRLSGAELSAAEKPRFMAISEELAGLSAKFSENLLDATNAFTHLVSDHNELLGIPPDVQQAAQEAALKQGKDGWLFTLHMPSYQPLLQYAEHRPLRALMYRAYVTRAAEFGAPELDNSELIKRILVLRKEQAQMLGYAHFADLSLASKMAESVPQVLEFLRDLARKAKPFAEQDIAELRAFARQELKLETLEPWDIAYASEKLLQARFAFSEQAVKQYFTEDKVLAGLFSVVEKLFNVRIKADSAPVWHDTVRFFRIEKPASEAGEARLIGQFYLDLYARESKRGGAWMDEAVSRKRSAQGIQTPIAYLNCNFSAPVSTPDGQKKAATFTHDEVITLFHESGHGLHHLLTQVEELGVSGIHGVEWDAVELPSQFMENYCWEWSVLQNMSAHIDSGEALPRELFDKMRAAKNFQSGLQNVRQIEFSLFDLRLHSDYDPAGKDSAGGAYSVLDLLNEIRREVAVIMPPPWHRFANSFSHIFAGGYGAGYFSYKWAEVLSADCYAAFEESGDPFDPSTGARFLAEILAMGGTRPALESFRAFRGRAPEVDALLKHSGMIPA